MIKKIERYPELADPQLQPRYSGIPTFFRLPQTVRLDVSIGDIGSVAHQPASIDELTRKIDCRNYMARRQPHELVTLAEQKRVFADN
jgi:hypothetical protein